MSQQQVESAISWCVSCANDPQYYYVSPAQPPYGWDCSSFVIEGYRQAGVNVHSAYDTSNMVSELTRDNVFTDIPFDINIAQRGDIFMWDGTGNDGHACLYLGNNQIVHAANSTVGIVVTTYYPNNYTDILRLTNQTPIQAQWYAKSTGGYDRSTNEAQNNAIMIYTLLTSLGWTLPAICGVLGNIFKESAYNPWAWENNIILSSTDPDIDTSLVHGYGLVQFTPSGKYLHDSRAQSMQGFAPNYSDIPGNPNDGNAQMLFVDSYGDYQPRQAYPQTYAEYKVFTGTPEYATEIWMYNYERPLYYDTLLVRQQEARFWYEFLQGFTPTAKRSKLPILLIDRIVKNKTGGKNNGKSKQGRIY